MCDRIGRVVEKELSIVVPVYNVEEYLPECIESILGQTMLPDRIILVDDGSSDDSGKICDRYSDEYSFIKVVHQSNKGVSSARYVGCLNVDTEYLLFIDADDFIKKDLIEKVSPYLEKSIDIVTFGLARYQNPQYIRNDSLNVKEGIYERKALEEVLFPRMLWDPNMHVPGIDASLCNKVFKKELLIDLLYEISLLNIHYGEDVGVVYFAMLRAGSFAVIDEHMYYHRQKKERELPKYIVDEAFIDKLHVLYKYMCGRIGDDKALLKQLEYFYLHGLETRMRIYGDYRTRRQYVFPFDKVRPGKRIAIYGAGAVGQDYYKQVDVIDYCREVLWVDQNYGKYSGFKVFSPDELFNRDKIETVVIAILSENAEKEVRRKLLDNGYSNENVIWSIRC